MHGLIVTSKEGMALTGIKITLFTDNTEKVGIFNGHTLYTQLLLKKDTTDPSCFVYDLQVAITTHYVGTN